MLKLTTCFHYRRITALIYTFGVNLLHTGSRRWRQDKVMHQPKTRVDPVKNLLKIQDNKKRSLKQTITFLMKEWCTMKWGCVTHTTSVHRRLEIKKHCVRSIFHSLEIGEVLTQRMIPKLTELEIPTQVAVWSYSCQKPCTMKTRQFWSNWVQWVKGGLDGDQALSLSRNIWCIYAGRLE